MKSKKYFKKSIISLIMISAILLPYLSFTPNTYAQYSGGNSGYSSSSGATGQGVGYYMQLATPMIPKLQGCKDVMKNGIGKGINAIKDLFNKGDSSLVSTLKDKLGSATSSVDSVATNSEAANKISGSIETTTQGAKKVADVTASNKLCLDSVGKMIAKMLIKTLTDSTIKWINTGNFGESFWPKDRQHFFEDIAKNEVLKFNSEINNPNLYPFARAFMQNQIFSLKNHFAQNAQYSLNEMIKDTTPEYTSATFTADFSSGGWNAWNALTQVPANNPIGFNITASNELQSRLTGTTQTAAQDVRDTLKEAGGFLGQEQCASNKSITRETERNDLKNGNPYASNSSDAAFTSWNDDHICQKWEYVTPGKMIAEASTKLMGDQKDQLLNINDLNDAIAAILDAAINKYGGDLMNQGLASLSPTHPNDQFDLTDPTGNGGKSQVEQDFAGSQGNTAWLQENPDFNIRTDITQALVDQQITNVSKLESYNKELDALIRTIYQLDYCMPGPHPGWEEEARTKLDGIEENMKSEIAPSQTDLIAQSVAGIADPTGLSGAGFSLLLAKKQRTELHYYINGIVTSLTGLNGFSTDIDSHNSLNKDWAVTFLDGVFNAYSSTINKYFKDALKMPFTWRESVEKFNQIPGYRQIIEDNKSEIIFQNENIKKLKTLKAGIDNGTYTDADFLPTGYVIRQFSRVSQNLVSGDSLASTNSLYEQTKAERDYVWNDLLKGPGGCEQELYNTWVSTDAIGFTPAWAAYDVRRPSYPFQILYDYNLYAKDALLPNNPTTPIPGIVFTSTSNYQNKQAFQATDNGTPTAYSFLNNIFRVGTPSYPNSFSDSWTCESLGVSCTANVDRYADTPTIERSLLGGALY